MTAISAKAASSAVALARKGVPRSDAIRNAWEFVIRGLLGCTALISIAITVGIIAILLRETISFIQLPEIELTDFLFGTTWSPLLGAEKHFGIWPLICGTFLVSVVAAMTAIPLGLITAIYLSEYATATKRAFLKPVIEILAGVPTVVYGFFALLVITPALQGACKFLFGAPIFSGYNAGAAGIAVGIMILPIVASLSEDAMQSVPRSLREGAYALGSTKFDVSVKVVTPAALSG